jgi:predicted AAA+ superfamily ATPase
VLDYVIQSRTLRSIKSAMDPVTNPFAPGAGSLPPELAGRDQLRKAVEIAIQRIRGAFPTKSVLMVGLRGVGKTVLLDRMRSDAEAQESKRFKWRHLKIDLFRPFSRPSSDRLCCAYQEMPAQRI